VLREPARLIAYRRLLVDAFLTAASFLLAHQLRAHVLPRVVPALFPAGIYPLTDYLPLLVVALALWVFLLAGQRPGSVDVFSLRSEVKRVLRAVALGVVLLASGDFLLRLQFISRPFLLLFGVTNAVLLAGARIVERRTAWGRKLLEAPERMVVIVGCGEQAVEMAQLVVAHREWGLTLRGLVDADGSGRGEVEGFPVVCAVEALPEYVTREVVDDVVLAVQTRQLGELEGTLLRCHELGVRVRLALRPFPHVQPRLEVENLNGVPLLTFATTPTSVSGHFAKRVIDVVVAVSALAVTAVFWPLIALAIRLSSRGPVLYRQVRCSLQGRRFELLKFRTMVEGADRMQPELAHLNVMDGPVFKAPGDPRVTRVGRWLRRWSLDELPQLVNVLMGDMSLVGPRPPLPEEVERYEPWQRRRLAMKPGLTCLWQVSGRSELDFGTWMAMDLAYIDHWSLWLDFKILLRTVPAVLSGRGAS
jgi:exopolysaccharide biosynthesis polyprenyl glycosylphosphotransferase